MSVLTNVAPAGNKRVHAWVALERIEAEGLFGMKWREIAAHLGITPRALRNYRAILKAEYKSLCDSFEAVASPVQKPERTTVLESILRIPIAVRSVLGIIYNSLLKTWVGFAKDVLTLSEDSSSLENDLKVVPKNLLSDDKESIRTEMDSSPASVTLTKGNPFYKSDPEPEPLCLKHFCREAHTYVHINRLIGECTVCHMTFDEALTLIGDPVESVSICGGNL